VRVGRLAEQSGPVVARDRAGCPIERVDQVTVAGENRNTFSSDAEIVQPEPKGLDHRLRRHRLVEEDLRVFGAVGVLTDGSVGLVPAAEVHGRVAEVL
jgi:hypothetical protein